MAPIKDGNLTPYLYGKYTGPRIIMAMWQGIKNALKDGKTIHRDTPIKMPKIDE